MKIITVVLTAFLLSSCISISHHKHDDDHHHDHHHDHHQGDDGRLLVYTDDGSVTVLDAGDGDVIAQFKSVFDPGAAAVNASSTGEFGFVIHRDSWLTAVIDSGYHLEEHGAHYDLHVEEPAFLGTVAAGARPAHYASALGKSIIYNDDEGTIAVFDEKSLRESLSFYKINARVDHGAPVITGESIVTGYLNAPEIDVIGYDGMVKQTLSSGTKLHGQARLGRFLVFGVMEGVVLLTWDINAYSSSVIQYPEKFPEGGRIGHFKSHILVPHFIGRVESSLAKIDHMGKTITLHEMPSAFRLFYFDSTGKYLAVLGSDGVLYSIDPDTMAVKGSVKAASPVDNMPAPSLAMGKHHAWVSDPAAGKILMISLHDMEIEAEFNVSGNGKIGGIALMQTEGVMH